MASNPKPLTEAVLIMQAKLNTLEGVANMLAVDLECMSLDPQNVYWHSAAERSVQKYRVLMDEWYPQDHVSPMGKD